jgi:cell division septal protein FtsQ
MTAGPPAPPAPPAPPGAPQSVLVARPPIDPRMRQRRIEVRREEGRRRLRFLGALIAAALVAVAGVGIAHSRLLAVHHVEVSGAAHTSREQVLAAAGLSDRRLMIDVHPGQVALRLDQLPWVATAAVSRHWPTTVKIRITERAPAALVAANPGQVAVVDDTGRVLALGAAPPPAPAGPHRQPVAPVAPGPAPGLQLPTIVGLDPAGGPGSTLTDGEPTQSALALVAASRRDLVTSATRWITTVSVGDDGQLTATLSPSIVIRLGPADQLDAKLLALRALLEQVNVKGVATIDIRVPVAPVLTRANGTGTVSTTSRG